MSPRPLVRGTYASGGAFALAVGALTLVSCATGGALTTGRVSLNPSELAPEGAAYTSDSLYLESDGAGPPVVFVHAFSMDHRMWDGQVAALRGSFRVIRYDQRGYGHSPAALRVYRSIDDLRSVLDAVHERRVTIVGLSSGAQIAADFALAYPERVARLVLVSPGLSGYVPAASPPWMKPVVDAARHGDAETTARAWAATPLMHVANASASEAILEMSVANAGVWRGRQNLEQPVEHVALGRLHELRVPVLLLVGTADVSEAARVADLILARVPGAQRVMVPGAGHLVNLAAPREFDSAVERFLQSTTGFSASL